MSNEIIFPTIAEIEKMKSNEIYFKIKEMYQRGREDGINKVFERLNGDKK